MVNDWLYTLSWVYKKRFWIDSQPQQSASCTPSRDPHPRVSTSGVFLVSNMLSIGNPNRPHHFKAKNSFYLRISDRCVLLMKILIDAPHLNWFNSEENSKVILAKLVEILKPRVLNKLNDEQSSNHKKSKLDIYRGSGFQFGYYFRNQTYQHSILLKSKESINSIQSAPSGPDNVTIDEVEDIKPDLNDPSSRLASSSLKVHYQPFSIFGKSLVVIIEPYPLPNQHKSEISSIATDFNSQLRNPRIAETGPENPLFIPDDDERVLEDIDFDLSPSLPSQSTLLSTLIKDPTSDRQLDHKSHPKSLSLHDFLSPDPSAKMKKK